MFQIQVIRTTNMERIDLSSVAICNQLFGFKTFHPLVAVVDLTKATKAVNHAQIHYGLYALFLKGGKDCDIQYGRRAYDYQEGTLVSFAPGQVAEINMLEDNVHPKVYGLLFHPDLIRGTVLGEHIGDYSFFSYFSREALHLSQRERDVVMDCLHKIQEELIRPQDKQSKQLILMNIDLLLNYCLRFYERQFDIRELSNKDVLQKFEKLLDDYLASHLPQKLGVPTVAYFADKVFLSSNYFGDLVKKETGRSAQEYIQFKIIEKAKDLIAGTDLTISEIAYILGFSYPQHLGRLFKRYTGMTPRTYRLRSIS